MPIGRLYFPVTRGSILPVSTLLGKMLLIPDGNHQAIPAGDFDVRLSEELGSLNVPVKFYDVFPPKASSGNVRRIGHGFIGPVPAIELGYGILFRYSNRQDRTPTLVYRSKEFSVYHAINTATLITLPRTVPQIEELLLAI
jgi:hypothetical protein